MDRDDVYKLFSQHEGEDARAAAELFQEGATGAGNQRHWVRFMEGLLDPELYLSQWPQGPPAGPEAQADIRRGCRWAVYTARHSDVLKMVLNAGLILGEAGRRDHPTLQRSEFKKWSWQYLGHDSEPGVKWGFTTSNHPIQRVRGQRGLKLDALLPVVGRELDAQVKAVMKDDLIADPDRPETYDVTHLDLVFWYQVHRKG